MYNIELHYVCYVKVYTFLRNAYEYDFAFHICVFVFCCCDIRYYNYYRKGNPPVIHCIHLPYYTVCPVT